MELIQKKGEIISLEQRSLVSDRYKRITKAVNREFWNSKSDTEHSFYVGSYGRGTAINTSDIDILVELPNDEFAKYDTSNYNGQSRLLQVLRNAILDTYPRSNVHADGQVVVIDFTDGIKFEVLPAFRQFFGDNIYTYPDTNNGGQWKITNPKAEQEAMKIKNQESNGLLLNTCKHMRSIRDNHFSSYHLPGIVIDSFVYKYIGDWHWLRDGECGSQPLGTYEQNLYQRCPITNFHLTAPGSEEDVDVTKCINVLKAVLNLMSND